MHSAVLTEEGKLENNLTVCFSPLIYSGVSGSLLDIFRFLNQCALELCQLVSSWLEIWGDITMQGENFSELFP